MSGLLSTGNCSLCGRDETIYYLVENMCIHCIHDELERVRKEREEFKASQVENERLKANGPGKLLGSHLLKGRSVLLKPDWCAMDTDERLLHACLLAYVKHHNGVDIIGWDKLGDVLHNAICEAVGDDNYVAWNQRVLMECAIAQEVP